VIKTLALPKLIHLQSLFNDLNKLFFNFIWDGKPGKIKRNTLIADFEDGGLRMIHLQQFNAYLKITWVKRLFSNLKVVGKKSWHTFPTHIKREIVN
jgi:hypothetical protein